MKAQIVIILLLSLALIAVGLYIPHQYVVTSRTDSISERIKLLRGGVVEILRQATVDELPDYESHLLQHTGLEDTGTTYLLERLLSGGCRVVTTPTEAETMAISRPEYLIGVSSSVLSSPRPFLGEVYPCPKSVESIFETRNDSSESFWTNNYKGVRVLSVAEHVSFIDSNYFLVAEMDKSEVFVPVWVLAKIYLMVYLAFVVLFSGMAYYLMVLVNRVSKANYQREKAYAELKAETEWRKHVLDEMPLGIFTTNLDEQIIYVNDEFLRIFSGRDAAKDSTPMREFIGENEQRIFNTFDADTRTIEYEDGFYRVRIVKVRNEGFLGVIADTTASMLREKHVRKAMEMAISSSMKIANS